MALLGAWHGLICEGIEMPPIGASILLLLMLLRVLNNIVLNHA